MIGTALALLLAGMTVAVGLSSDNNPPPAPPVNTPSSVRPTP